MKYLGPTSDDKDIATKKYVDDATPIAKLSSEYGLVKPVMMAQLDGYNYTGLELQDGYGNTICRELASINEATTSHRGLMSSTDKSKLDGIATGAEVNQNAFSNVKVGSTTIQADGKTDTIELVAGDNITLTPDSANDKVTINASSGGDHIELTQAEYDALSQAEKENGTVYFITDGTPDYTIINDSVPIGAVQAYAGASLPYGWLFCNGAAVSRETYSELFEAIGTAYGSGDGSTTFNLPDLRGRVSIGVGSIQANNQTYWGSDVTNLSGGSTDFSLGETGGETKHTLSLAQIPSHDHNGAAYYDNSYRLYNGAVKSGSDSVQVMLITGGSGTSHTVKVEPNGSDAAHNNMQPYVVTNYIIKALNTVSSSVLEELDPQSIIFDLLYPVGSYYETSDITFDPNVQWRGTWVSESKKNDYIVEEGTSGIWTYRKWASGIAECWCAEQQESSANPTGSEGNVWWRGRDAILFPSGLFISIPNCVVWGGNQGSMLSWTSRRQISAQSISWYWVYDMNAAMAPNYTIQAKGLWKTYSAPASKTIWHRTA